MSPELGGFVVAAEKQPSAPPLLSEPLPLQGGREWASCLTKVALLGR